MSTFNIGVLMALFIIVVSGIYHMYKKISRWIKQKQRQNDARKQSKISYTRAFFLEQREHNLQPPNEQLKEIVKEIQSYKDGEDENSFEVDKSSQQRTQRVSSYNFQSKQQGSNLLPKNRKKTNSIDQAQAQAFRDNNANGNGNQFQVKPKTNSIPLSQIIQNIEQQNQLNQANQDSSSKLMRENISLSHNQINETSNCLKTLIANLRNTKAKKVEKDQQASTLIPNEDQQKLIESLLIKNPSSNDVVQQLILFSNLKQNLNSSTLQAEEYKQLTLNCIQCNLRDWADFLLQDMQSQAIQPDRFLLDEYMKIVVNLS